MVEMPAKPASEATTIGSRTKWVTASAEDSLSAVGNSAPSGASGAGLGARRSSTKMPTVIQAMASQEKTPPNSAPRKISGTGTKAKRAKVSTPGVSRPILRRLRRAAMNFAKDSSAGFSVMMRFTPA